LAELLVPQERDLVTLGRTVAKFAMLPDAALELVRRLRQRAAEQHGTSGHPCASLDAVIRKLVRAVHELATATEMAPGSVGPRDETSARAKNAAYLADRAADMLVLLACAPEQSRTELRRYLAAALDDTATAAHAGFIAECGTGAFGEHFATAAAGAVTAALDLGHEHDASRIAADLVRTVLSEGTFVNSRHEPVRLLSCLPVTTLPADPTRDPILLRELDLPGTDLDGGTVLCWRGTLWQVQSPTPAAVPVTLPDYQQAQHNPCGPQAIEWLARGGASRPTSVPDLTPCDPRTLAIRASLLGQTATSTDLNDSLSRVEAAIQNAADGVLPTSDQDVVALLEALSEHDVRDAVLWQPTEHVAAAETLWIALVQGAPDPERAEPATALAISAYIRGDRDLLAAALVVAREANPGHRLARQIDQAAYYRVAGVKISRATRAAQRCALKRIAAEEAARQTAEADH
jgi:hypothetical protein